MFQWRKVKIKGKDDFLKGIMTVHMSEKFRVGSTNSLSTTEKSVQMLTSRQTGAGTDGHPDGQVQRQIDTVNT